MHEVGGGLDGPAERAGLKADDTTLSLNGVALSKDSVESFMAKDDVWTIGNPLILGLKRGADVRRVKLTLEKVTDTQLARMIETHTRESHTIAKN